MYSIRSAYRFFPSSGEIKNNVVRRRTERKRYAELFGYEWRLALTRSPLSPWFPLHRAAASVFVARRPATVQHHIWPFNGRVPSGPQPLAGHSFNRRGARPWETATDHARNRRNPSNQSSPRSRLRPAEPLMSKSSITRCSKLTRHSATILCSVAIFFHCANSSLT